ncbi:hypothetical protein D3C72_1611030 [compost metagenome]
MSGFIQIVRGHRHAGMPPDTGGQRPLGNAAVAMQNIFGDTFIVPEVLQRLTKCQVVRRVLLGIDQKLKVLPRRRGAHLDGGVLSQHLELIKRDIPSDTGLAIFDHLGTSGGFGYDLHDNPIKLPFFPTSPVAIESLKHHLLALFDLPKFVGTGTDGVGSHHPVMTFL